MPEDGIEITVAVPVKDRREQMERCLASLLQQDHPSYEVLVLDNESSDGTPDACQVLGSKSAVPVRVEVVPGTVGAVRNQAGHLAKGEFLAFTDSDCVAEPGWLSAMARSLRADDRLGIVCGRTRPQDPVVKGWPATIEVSDWSGRFESCNIAVRAEAFRQSDGFDEQIGHFWEDTAAGYALIRNGWKTAFVPDAIIYHDVTYPGFVWHLKRAMKTKNLGPVLRRYPEIAHDLFWAGLFLHRRDAKLVVAWGGILTAVARRRPGAALLAVPYAQERLRHWHDPRGMVQTLLYDTAVVVGAARAGITARRFLL